jgi:cytochrome c553
MHSSVAIGGVDMFTTSRILVLLLSLATLSANAAEPNPADRELAKRLATELKGALSSALQTSPEHAIAVCNEQAPQIAAKIATDANVQIGRTALKLRNPKNAPSEWQRAVLLDFQNRLKSGEAIGALEYSAAVKTGAQTEHRYMKAIPTEPLCLTCHGKQLTPSLQQAIRAKYPNDAATGFDVGDIRGAVYVVRRSP